MPPDVIPIKNAPLSAISSDVLTQTGMNGAPFAESIAGTTCMENAKGEVGVPAALAEVVATLVEVAHLPFL